MRGTCLTFYVLEKQKLHGILAYEWLIEKAKTLGLPGASVFRSIAGFGRHGHIHDEHFYELQGDLPVEVVFAVTDADAERLLRLIRVERLLLVYSRFPIEFGVVNRLALKKPARRMKKAAHRRKKRP